MKIFLLRNNIQDLDTLNKGCELATQKCANIGFPLEFLFADTTKQFTSQPFSNAPNNEGYVSGTEIVPQQVFDEVKRLGYKMALDSIACLVFDATKITPSPTNPIDNGVVIQFPTQWYATYPEVFCEFFLHELTHYLFSATQQKDVTHDYPPNFSQKTRTDYYLYLILTLEPYFNALLGATMPQDTSNPPTAPNTYKYFKPSEIIDLKPELVSLLDQARGIAGVPFKITSGYRSVLKNLLVGGKVGSAHTTGEAVDLACTDASSRYKILTALLKVGFNRTEIAAGHIHCDISKMRPQNIIDFSEDL
jgi:hypothetical protein